MSVRFSWNHSKVLAEVDKRIERGLERAAMFVEGVVIKSISEGQPPSVPGEPPHVLRGRLRQSVTHKVFKQAGKWIAVIGAGVKYARRLELGFVGTDSKGRNVSQAPRPYLRPAIVNNRDKILRLIFSVRGSRVGSGGSSGTGATLPGSSGGSTPRARDPLTGRFFGGSR